MDKGFKTEIRDRALIIRFDRPYIRSPLSIHVLDGLTKILADDIVLSGVDAIIFTGYSDVFASGADLREIADMAHSEAKEFSLRGQTLMNLIASLGVVSVAAINGYCFGGALDLALACDHRIASTNATFAHPGSSLGIITGWGGTQRLPRLIGQANALEMFFTAGMINAAKAFRIGLVEMIAEDVLEAALSRALLAGS